MAGCGVNMKIKLSKSQWEQIGKTAGWLSQEAKKKKKKWNPNPWAVCHTTVDKDKNPEKFERCVQDVKKKQAGTEPQVTPIIRKSRTITEEYDICPHCGNEIMEKSTFAETRGDTWYIYHGSCKDKGPIQKVTKEDSEKAFKMAFPEKS